MLGVTKSLKIMFPLPIQLDAGYSVKLKKKLTKESPKRGKSK